MGFTEMKQYKSENNNNNNNQKSNNLNSVNYKGSPASQFLVKLKT